MAKSQLFKPPRARLHPQSRRRVSGPARPARRGGVHHGAHDLRSGGHGPDVRGGRALTQQGARQAEAGLGRLALEAGVPVVPVAIHGSEHVANANARCSRRSRSSTASRSLRPGRPPDAEQSQEVADQVFDRVRAMYEALAKPGPPGSAGAPASERGEAPRHWLSTPHFRSCARASGRSSRDRVAVGVGQLDRDRELDPAVGVEPPSSASLRLAQRAGGGDRAARELQVGDLGLPASGVMSPMRSANAPTNAPPEAASPAENSAPACCEPTWLCRRRRPAGARRRARRRPRRPRARYGGCTGSPARVPCRTAS